MSYLPHEGSKGGIKVCGLRVVGFRVSGFRVLWFRVLRFRALGFKGLAFAVKGSLVYTYSAPILAYFLYPTFHHPTF